MDTVRMSPVSDCSNAMRAAAGEVRLGSTV